MFVAASTCWSLVLLIDNGHGGKHRLVFRVAHAQFDGYTWGMMIQTLTSFYHQKSQPMKPTFRQLIAFNERKKESFHYWASRLQNSSQPSWSLSSPSDAVYSTADRINVSISFPMPSIQHHEGISTATFYHAAFYHAACALVFLKCPEKKMLSLAVW